MITTLKRLFIYTGFIASLSVFFLSCEKEEDPPANPYDNVDYNPGNGNNEPEPDPTSIQGLHKNIFSKKCALSGCHDGTFEPDFRTVQSSYASLVYQPVIKNTVNGTDTFALRVYPSNHIESFIYERITTSTTEYMPSNGVRLPQSDIDNIKAWIDNGAKDESGNVPVKPNLQPNIGFYVAVDSTFIVRLDTNRLGGLFINPFLVSPNTTFYIGYFPTDSLDGLDATAIGDFTNCRIKFSTDKNNFSAAITNNSFYTNGVWVNALNSGLWSPGTTVYFRIYVNDGDHFADAEFPIDASPDYYKTIFAFYVQ